MLSKKNATSSRHQLLSKIPVLRDNKIVIHKKNFLHKGKSPGGREHINSTRKANNLCKSTAISESIAVLLAGNFRSARVLYRYNLLCKSSSLEYILISRDWGRTRMTGGWMAREHSRWLNPAKIHQLLLLAYPPHANSRIISSITRNLLARTLIRSCTCNPK